MEGDSDTGSVIGSIHSLRRGVRLAFVASRLVHGHWLRCLLNPPRSV